MHAYALVEITDRFAAWFDHRSPMQALAFSPVSRRNDLPALQRVIEGAADVQGSEVATFLRQYQEIRLSVHDASHILHKRMGEPFGLILSGALVKPAKKIFSLLGISENLLHVLPDEPLLDPVSLRKVMNHFLYFGAKSVAVCLDQDGSSRVCEEEIRNILHQAFPSQYLGSVPVLVPPAHLSQQGQERLESVIVNGYVRAGLAQRIRDTINFLRLLGYRGSITARDVSGHYVPVAQCDPWSFIVGEYARFEDSVYQWTEEQSIVSGMAVCLNFDYFETAIIGNYQIQSKKSFLSSQISLPALPPLETGVKRNYDGSNDRDCNDEDHRQIRQWVNRLIPEIRRRADAGELQLLSTTPLFIYGSAGGLVGCALAEALGIHLFQMHLGRRLNDHCYETECRIPSGWAIQHQFNTQYLRLRRVR